MCIADGAATKQEVVATVLAAAAALGGQAQGGGGDADLGAVLAAKLVTVRHAIDLLELEFSVTAAEFAATDHWDQEGSVDPRAWIRHHCNLSSGRSSRAVQVGEHLDGLPQSTEAMREGRIGFEHLALIASTADEIRGSVTAAPFHEDGLLTKALAHSVSRFRHDCAHARHAADVKKSLDDHLQTHAQRRLELRTGSAGGLFLRGMLDPVAGATVRTALEALARKSGADDRRDRLQRMADALTELAAHGLDAGVVPQQGGRRVHLQLTASIQTLQGMAGADAGDLDFSSPIPAVAVQRLACDASITRVLFGADSAVIDVGRTLRLPCGATRRALTARDGGCVWPGCERPSSWTSAHHIRFWAHGGATDLDNLVLLCHRHHWLVHEGGWQLLRIHGGAIHTVPPAPGQIPLPRPPFHMRA